MRNSAPFLHDVTWDVWEQRGIPLYSQAIWALLLWKLLKSSTKLLLALLLKSNLYNLISGCYTNAHLSSFLTTQIGWAGLWLYSGKAPPTLYLNSTSASCSTITNVSLFINRSAEQDVVLDKDFLRLPTARVILWPWGPEIMWGGKDFLGQYQLYQEKIPPQGILASHIAVRANSSIS